MRDDRPFGGQAPPAAMFYYSRDRRQEHPEEHLTNYTGILQADAYGGYNPVFAPDRGGQRAAVMYSLIVTAKMNDIDPQAWLADILARLPSHPAHRIDELLPWNWKVPIIHGASHDQRNANCMPQSCSG